jgi:exodeoxyribonuclease VII large subunit
MVSHQRVKTPTAAAAFLIDHVQAVADAIDDAQNRMTRYTQQKLTTLHSQLSTLQQALPRLFSVFKTRQEARLESIGLRIPMIAERKLTAEHHKLELVTERLKALDPILLLKRGYSITRFCGHTLRDPMKLHEGDVIETIMEKGTIKSIIK